MPSSFIVILAASWGSNWLFARILRIPPNVESVYITALILVLILEPASLTDLAGLGALAFASVWAIATKFLLTVGRKHVFNPAAAGAVLSALVLDHPATWWVGGNTALLPAVLIGGLLLVRKLRRFDLVGAFVVVALATTFVTSPSPLMALNQTLFSSPLLFLAFVMLTEPLTSPTMPAPRLVFAAIVGVLFAPDVHFGSFYLTPEMALLAGNVFALATGPRGRMLLTLERIEQQAADTYDFVFRPQRRLAFEPGQYLEWTLPLGENDSRGNRRYFTIASAPERGPGSRWREVLSKAQRVQTRARCHASGRPDIRVATRRVSSRCRGMPTPNWYSSPAASASRLPQHAGGSHRPR